MPLEFKTRLKGQYTLLTYKKLDIASFTYSDLSTNFKEGFLRNAEVGGFLI